MRVVVVPVSRVGGVGHLCVFLLTVGGGECVSVLRCQSSHVTRGIVSQRADAIPLRLRRGPLYSQSD